MGKKLDALVDGLETVVKFPFRVVGSVAGAIVGAGVGAVQGAVDGAEMGFKSSSGFHPITDAIIGGALGLFGGAVKGVVNGSVAGWRGEPKDVLTVYSDPLGNPKETPVKQPKTPEKEHQAEHGPKQSPSKAAAKGQQAGSASQQLQPQTPLQEQNPELSSKKNQPKPQAVATGQEQGKKPGLLAKVGAGLKKAGKAIAGGMAGALLGGIMLGPIGFIIGFIIGAKLATKKAADDKPDYNQPGTGGPVQQWQKEIDLAKQQIEELRAQNQSLQEALNAARKEGNQKTSGSQQLASEPSVSNKPAQTTEKFTPEQHKEAAAREKAARDAELEALKNAKGIKGGVKAKVNALENPSTNQDKQVEGQGVAEARKLIPENIVKTMKGELSAASSSTVPYNKESGQGKGK